MSEGAGTTSQRLVPLGEIVGTHGVGGLLRFRWYSPNDAALTAPTVVHLEPRHRPADAARPQPSGTLRLLSARPHGRVVLLQFEGIATIDEATPLVGSVVSIPERELPAVAPGEYYAYQLEGLEVVTAGGDRLGTVAHSFPTGSNDVLVVRDGDREHLIPVIADVVRRVDLSSRTIVIQPIEGLLD